MIEHLQTKTQHWLGSAFVALSVTLVGCAQNGQTVLEDRPNVVASYSILCDLTEQIAQDTINLTCLVGPDEDPHAYQATPGDRQAIEQAELVLYGGFDHEATLVQLIEASSENTQTVAVHEQAVPDPLMGHHHHHGEDDHDHGHHSHAIAQDHGHSHDHTEGDLQPDPHVWHDVQNSIRMVEIIRDQLAQVNPDATNLYTQNAEELTATLSNLDNWVREQINTIPAQQRKLVTTHDALSYYAQAYNIEQVAALQGVIPDEQPTAARVRELVSEIQQTQVPAIFVEATMNSRIIETVAREANVEVADEPLYVDGLGAEGTQAGTYIGMITHNTCVITENLGGQCNPFEG